MARAYTLKKRAEQQAGTRQRIVEAAVDLHSAVGPSMTTISMIAEKAGVQRHTVYAHFPDEKSLLMACSGLAAERDPLPDANLLRDIDDPGERRRGCLSALYGWYERNADLAGCIARDVEHHAATREIVRMRRAPHFDKYRALLVEDAADAGERAAVELALSYYTWRTLTREGLLDRAAAVEVMLRAIRCARKTAVSETGRVAAFA